MKDIHEVKKYAAKLSNKNLMAYYRLCLRNGIDDKAAVCDMEIEIRRHEGRWN